MSSDSTSVPPPGPVTPPAGPVVRFLMDYPRPVAWGLLAVAFVLLFLGGRFLVKADVFSSSATQAEEPSDPAAPPAAKPVKPRQTEFLLTGILALIGGLTALMGMALVYTGLGRGDTASLTMRAGAAGGAIGVAAGMVGSAVADYLSKAQSRQLADPAALRRSVARVTLLLVGGVFGMELICLGLILFVLWFKSLSDWLDAGKASEAKWVLGPLVLVLAGAGLAFLCALPARAEERNSPLLRRLVYGTNAVLGAVLVLVLLIAGNVFAALKVPNKLDTTESGFYTLSDQTKEYLANLKEPVKVYSTLMEGASGAPGRVMRDMRQVLAACQEANPSKFQVRYLDVTLNKDEITALKNKYPQADLDKIGVLITVGEDEKRYAFISYDDLFTTEGGGRGEPSIQFQGESRLIRELLFLSENQTKPVVYFTAGHGELDVAGGGPTRAAGRRPAGQLRAALEKAYIDARPLEFDLVEPKVPADAAVVAVADPRTPFTPEQVAALRKYMTEPRADGKKGKLAVLTSPSPRPDGTGVIDLGLDGLLAEFGVRLGREYILNAPDPQLGSFPDTAVMPGEAALTSRNPIIAPYMTGNTVRVLVFPNCRTVTPAPGGGPYQPEVLFETVEGRITWLETDPPSNPTKTLQDMLRGDRDTRIALIKAKRASQESRPVAVIVSEAGSARVAVYGSGEVFADPAGRQRSSDLGGELFVGTVNWLRDRPAVAALATKTYGRYTPNPKADEVRLLWLPGGVAALAVLALGAGVWVLRRQ